jgi:hypothetical protein
MGINLEARLEKARKREQTHQLIAEEMFNGLKGEGSVSDEALRSALLAAVRLADDLYEEERAVAHWEGVYEAVHGADNAYKNEATFYAEIHRQLKSARLSPDQARERDDLPPELKLYLQDPAALDGLERLYRQESLARMDEAKLNRALARVDEMNLAQRKLLAGEKHRREVGTAFDHATAYDEIVSEVQSQLNRPMVYEEAVEITDRALSSVYAHHGDQWDAGEWKTSQTVQKPELGL